MQEISTQTEPQPKKYNKSTETRVYKCKNTYVPKRRTECECGKTIHEGMVPRHINSKQHLIFLDRRRSMDELVIKLREDIRRDILDSLGIQNGLVPQNIIGVDTQKPLETLVEG